MNPEGHEGEWFFIKPDFHYSCFHYKYYKRENNSNQYPYAFTDKNDVDKTDFSKQEILRLSTKIEKIFYNLL